MLQPEHCAPAQHKPKILNNELSNNSPSCLRSILASASSMQLKEGKRNSAATTPRQLKPQNRGTGTRSRRSRGHLSRASWRRARQLEPLTTQQQLTLKLLQTRSKDNRIERKAEYLALILACAHTHTQVLDVGSAFQFKGKALHPLPLGLNPVKGSAGKKLQSNPRKTTLAKTVTAKVGKSN